ncbi:MAG: recombinase family protein [Pseudonocardiaceae bacterium]
MYQDQLSGKDADRPGLTEALDHLLEGDTLVVTELSRLGRSLQDLITIVTDLRRRQVGFRSLHEQLDTATPGGRLVFHVFAALAEFIRELIVEGTHEGLDAARARGQKLGRPTVMTPEKIRMAAELVGKESVAAIARLLGVNRATVYAHVPEAAKSTPHSPTARSSASERPVPIADLTPEPFPGLLVPLFLEGRFGFARHIARSVDSQPSTHRPSGPDSRLGGNTVHRV